MHSLWSPVCRAEDERGCLRQLRPRRVEEQPGVGASEGLHRTVRISQEDDLDVIAGEQAQQAQRRAGELLGVIDDDQPHRGVGSGACDGVVFEQIGRSADDPGRVIGTWPRQRGDLVVFVEHSRRGHPLGAVLLPTEPGEVGGVDAVLHRPHEQVAQLVPEASGGQGGKHVLGPVGGGIRRDTGRGGGSVPVEQFLEHDILLGAAEQPWGWRPHQGSLLAQQRETEGGRGAGKGLGGRAAEPRRDRLPQPGRA